LPIGRCPLAVADWPLPITRRGSPIADCPLQIAVALRRLHFADCRLAVANSQLRIDHCLLHVADWPLPIGHCRLRLPVARCRLHFAYCRWVVADCPLPIARWPQPLSWCLLPSRLLQIVFVVKNTTGITFETSSKNYSNYKKQLLDKVSKSFQLQNLAYKQKTNYCSYKIWSRFKIVAGIKFGAASKL